MKKCTKCHIDKSLKEFNKKYTSPDGYRTYCRACSKKYNNERHKQIIYKTVYQKRCLKCNKKRLTKFFHKCIHNKDRCNSWCLDCVSLYKKDYNQKNREHRKKYLKNRLKQDPSLKLIKNYRTRTGMAFKNSNKSKSTEQLLGCSLEYFQNHIINQFNKGMTIDNYGKWHIDHITPLSSAKSKKELEQLCHYTNLQPLWAIDNMKKSNKILHGEERDI